MDISQLLGTYLECNLTIHFSNRILLSITIVILLFGIHSMNRFIHNLLFTFFCFFFLKHCFILLKQADQEQVLPLSQCAEHKGLRYCTHLSLQVLISFYNKTSSQKPYLSTLSQALTVFFLCEKITRKCRHIETFSAFLTAIYFLFNKL